MENDLIRRSDLLAKKCLIRGHLDTGSPCPSKVKAVPVDVIEREPAVDAVPVRHGRLVNANRRSKTYQRICTVCGGIAYFCGVGCSYKFCPNCGLKNDGGDKSDE